MNPKEKAKDLVDKFNQCALIAVDEIIQALEHNEWQNKDWIGYYNEVKQEIKDL